MLRLHVVGLGTEYSMGIRFLCPQGHKLHVKAYLAGRRGICPHCGAKMVIPHESNLRQPVEAARPAESRQKMADFAEVETMLESPAAATGTMPQVVTTALDEATDAIWYVRSPGGDQYGPADTLQMRRWLDESRIDPTWYAWREDWPDWRLAGDVFFASLQAAEPTTAAVPPPLPNGPPAKDASPQELLGAIDPPDVTERIKPRRSDPLTSVAADPVAARRRQRRQRNTIVLALLVTAVACLIPAVVLVLMNQ